MKKAENRLNNNLLFISMLISPSVPTNMAFLEEKQV